tara:strand:+ start:67563 stop:68387 length:825 start_codon:yes stop_codon:yes gene_type:complete
MGIFILNKMDKRKSADKFIELLEIVELLRSPDGCTWDKEQTNKSLLPYFLEEAYELIESVENNDWEGFKEELGDVLLHIIMQAQLSMEQSKFNISDTLDYINKKLINRHPQVFKNQNYEWIPGTEKNWEVIKQKEKNRNSLLEGVPLKLPSLSRAQRLQEKAASSGFDWNHIDQVWEKFHEEIQELKLACQSEKKENIEEELGDLLFSIVNLARFLKVPAESVLRKANKKFVFRFKRIEQRLKKEGKNFGDTSSKELNEFWDAIKKEKESNPLH